jgi:hypothetical protein
MIGLDQSLLVFKGMIQHLATSGMLDVEEVVHEIDGTGHWICALGKI